VNHIPFPNDSEEIQTSLAAPGARPQKQSVLQKYHGQTASGLILRRWQRFLLNTLDGLLIEANELLAIFAASQRTAKNANDSMRK
jgi:hypothetical protein